MSEQQDALGPQRTWSHLAGRRRRPSEYEIVSTHLLWSTDHPQTPWEVAPEGFMSDWYRKHRTGSPWTHEAWDTFRDPDELVYRTYNILQDGQEAHVEGLLDEHDELRHDKQLAEDWLPTLATLYTPGRYLMHTVQMASAYNVHMAPASTIANCFMFQAGDALRWVSRIAYRTRELANSHPSLGFARDERAHWEGHAAWQGFRELMERVLVTFDWAEAFVALNLVAKPAIDEACLRQFAAAARRRDDTLLSLLMGAQLRDSDRSRRWSVALSRFVATEDANAEAARTWLAKWVPLGDAAIDAFCARLPDGDDAATQAKSAAAGFRADLPFAR